MGDFSNICIRFVRDICPLDNIIDRIGTFINR